MPICPNCGIELGKSKERCRYCGAWLIKDATKVFDDEDSSMVEDLVTDFVKTGIVEEVEPVVDDTPLEKFYCYNCGKEITLDDNECPHCHVDIYGCPDCQGPIDPTADVCPYCNSPLKPIDVNAEDTGEEERE